MYGDKNGPSKWTDEIDALMCENWQSGVSATDCAQMIYAKFGVMFSRSAIMGRANRKGYKTSAPPYRHGPPGEKKPRAPKKAPKLLINLPPPLNLAPIAPIKQKPEHEDVPKSRKMTLLELPPRGCRYPTSPDDAQTHLFCGAPQKEGLVYCSHHAGICYRATPRQMESKGPVLIAGNAGLGAGL